MSSEYFEAQARDVFMAAGGAIRQQIGQPVIHVPAWQVCSGRSRGIVRAGVPRRQTAGA